jgi:hypothetical protein
MWNIPNRQVEINNSDVSYTMKTTKEKNFGTTNTNRIKTTTTIRSSMNDEERGNELIAPTSSVQPVYGVFDPDYARFFTKARIVAAEEGYALSVHGSFSRDMDMIAVPWTAYASHRTPMNLAAQVEYRTGWKLQSKEPTEREHGRLVWSFLAPETEDPRWIDFSVIPPNK